MGVFRLHKTHHISLLTRTIRIHIIIYIYIYGNPPPNELPTLVLYRKYRVKTAFPAGPDSVSLKNYRKQTQISRERVSQLIHVRREVHILYLLRTTEINLTFNKTCQSTHSGST